MTNSDWIRIGLGCLLGFLIGKQVTKVVHADSYQLLLGTQHYPYNDECQTNPGLQYTDDNNWSFMVYRNSQCDNSLSVSRAFPVSDSVNFIVGGATGYEHTPINAYISFTYSTDWFFAGLIPGFLIDKSTILYYGVKF